MEHSHGKSIDAARERRARWLGLSAGLLGAWLWGVLGGCNQVMGFEEGELGAPCIPSAECYTGPAGTRDVGECAAGHRTCLGVLPGDCSGQVVPAEEACNDRDDDCDGVTDEGCACSGDVGKQCFTGPEGAIGVGTCVSGTQICFGSRWDEECTEQRPPAAEECDGFDNDCDGDVDEDCPCATGTQQSCFRGRKEVLSLGICTSGIQHCENGVWGTCEGDVVPTLEKCDGKDNDCNGAVDDDDKCTCQMGETASCYVDKQEVIPCPGDLEGVCKCGVMSCADGKFGPCVGYVLPAPVDYCDGLKDDDCDGTIDNISSENGCTCLVGSTEDCYEGPNGTAGLGVCKSGTHECVGGKWGACLDQTLPSPEKCDGKDNNCDGSVDNIASAGMPCYLAKYADTPCYVGTLQCVFGTMEPQCVPKIQPGDYAETCDGLDNNCNGLVDDGPFCCPGDGQRNGNETDVDCGGSCTTKCVNGKACYANFDCMSNSCIDGVCCDTACEGPCAACNLPGFLGTCTSIPANQDPSNECVGVGACNGAGGCQLPAGAPCSADADCVSNACVSGLCL